MYICIYLKEKAFTKDDILYHKKLFSHDSTYLHSYFKQLFTCSYFFNDLSS